MNLEIDKAWFEERSRLEGDHEIGAGRAGPQPLVTSSMRMRAMLLAMAAVPAVAGIQTLMILMTVAVAIGDANAATAILYPAVMLFPTLAVAYVAGLLPTLIGALLIYPILQSKRSAPVEYLAAAALGGVVMVIHAALFMHAALAMLWMFGVLPAMAGVYVYRRRIPRES
ncbi:hypothetical protein G6L37_00750 [Agrobacterium rubi]|nr:hypothetical protein [Agrobacterium rubi]NTF23919.1 hypothetical protein [Agrobacterium rubi]